MEAEGLHHVIETMRERLYDLVSQPIPLTDPRVVALSQRLDKLLSQAQELKASRSKIRFACRVRMHNWILRRWFRCGQPSLLGRKRTKADQIPFLSSQ